MAIGVIWYPAIDQQAYEAISAKVMQPGADKGMRSHAAGEADGQWRIVEVWDSRDGLDAFIREDLAPAVDEVSGGQAETPHSRGRLRHPVPEPVGRHQRSHRS